MCDTSISIFKSISISRLPLFRLRDRYQYWKCLITISRPILIIESCYFDLDTDLDTSFVKITRQYQYDIDISAFLAIPTSISISNQSVSHITGIEVTCAFPMKQKRSKSESPITQLCLLRDGMTAVTIHSMPTMLCGAIKNK